MGGGNYKEKLEVKEAVAAMVVITKRYAKVKHWYRKVQTRAILLNRLRD